ncbi:MAG: DUF4114 domain-containing protein, partial [Gammaproteobacteria bacterium]|nr:DUF4114 domain-containing protein [Gammaproteobacteria bacterium]
MIDGQERMSWNGRLIFETETNGGPQGAVGSEDQAIAVHLDVALVDQDGSESITAIVISGLPEGATLSAGVVQADGSVMLDVNDLPGLTVTPAANSDQDFELRVAVTAQERDGGDSATTTTTVPVTVNAIADKPGLQANDAEGLENQPVALDINSALTDVDGSEVLSVIISDVPTGATLSAGTRQTDGTWTLSQSDLEGLSIIPSAGSDQDFVLRIQATSTEASNGSQAVSIAELAVSVAGVASQPVLSMADAQGTEDQTVALSIDVGSFDADGSELVTITIAGVPDGASLSAGRDNLDGSWSLSVDDLDGLAVTPALHSDDDLTLSVAVTATESDSGDSKTATGQLNVVVDAVADAPVFAAADGQGASTVSVRVAGTDFQGPPQFRLLVDGEQVGGIYTAEADHSAGEWQTVSVAGDFGPNGPQSVEVDYINDVWGGHWTRDRNLHVESIEVNGTRYEPAEATYDRDWFDDIEGQETMSWGGSLLFSTEDNAGPYAVAGEEDTAIALDLSAQLVDQDGSESLPSITLSGVPQGAVLLGPSSEAVEVAGPTMNVTDAQTVRIVYEGETAGYRNSFGVYEVDRESGAITDVRMVWENASLEGSGGDLIAGQSSFEFDVEAGTELGFFTVADGFSRNDFSAMGDGRWEFRTSTGEPADIDGASPTLWFVGADGRETAIDGNTYHFGDRTNLNPDGVAHSVGTVNVGDDSVGLGFEDLWGGGDRDFDDVRFRIEFSGETTEALHSANCEVTELEPNADGTYSLSAHQLSEIAIVPPPHSDEDFELTVTATSIEDANGDTATTMITVPVSVQAVADKPIVGASDVVGQEDTWIALALSGALVDTDGSEAIAYTLSNLPVGAKLDLGVDQGDGTWLLTAAELGNVSIKAPEHFSGTFDVNVQATSTEARGGDVASSDAAFTVTVDAVADAPLLSGGDLSGKEDNAIALNLTAGLVDTDGSESLAVLIEGVPDNAALSHGVRNDDGAWEVAPGDVAAVQLLPATDFKGHIELKVVATATDANADVATTALKVDIDVAAVADAPTVRVTRAAGNEDEAIELDISAALNDDSGSETLSVAIDGVPAGAVLSSGTRLPSGRWEVAPQDLADLTLVPAHNDASDFVLSVIATSLEQTGETVSTTATLPVTVFAVADSPVVETYNTSGKEDQYIDLGIGATLQDLDGSERLLVVVANVPADASLSHGTNNGDGTWTLEVADMPNVAILPPENFSGTLYLHLTTVSIESEGDSAYVGEGFQVVVDAVADSAKITRKTARVNEDETVALQIGVATSDDSEFVSQVVLSGVPQGARLSTGVDNGDGSWTLTQSELDGRS